MIRLPRSLEISARLAAYAIAWIRLRRRAPTELPQRLKRTLERLGTTFIKLGQAMSLRMDLLPNSYRQALEELQQQVAPFPGEQAAAMVEQAFGQPIQQLFASFDSEPLAAASVAQVHRARMPDDREVVVKIRRPGIAEQIRTDLRLLRRVLRISAWMWPALARQRPLTLVDELSRQLTKEIDFRNEARNMRRLAEALGDSNAVWMPGVIEPLVAEEVIVQDCSPGRPLAEEFGTSEGVRLASVLFDAYLHQLFVAGAFHGDPHPGNLFVLPDGRLCFHDFGQVGTLNRGGRRALAELLEAIALQDARAALDAAISLGVLAGPLERREFERGIEEILAEMSSLPLAEWSIADAVWRIARLGAGEHFTLPRHLLILMRTLFLLENTTRALNPDFQPVNELLARRETLRELILATSTDSIGDVSRMLARGVRDLPLLAAQWLHEAQADDGRPGISIHHRSLDQLETAIVQTGNRLAMALMALGLYVAAAVLMLHAAGPHVFGDIPLFALLVFAAALYLSLRLMRSITRSGNP